ncbi:MAG: hypothetical protein H6557_22660 [Lewinellaceae bacterium]|nr:hypothetical protein [Lewinellaceae bacterium]
MLSTFLFGCTLTEAADRAVIKEVQVLCIYWSSSFEMRDTLPAINYKLEFEEPISQNAEFSFSFSLDSNNIILPLKKVLQRKEATKEIIGLSLTSQELFPFFEDNQYVYDGPCYLQQLKKMVNTGEVFHHEGNKKKMIRKASDFSLVEGLK